jgi:Tfp pilus assembly protein PilF
MLRIFSSYPEENVKSNLKGRYQLWKFTAEGLAKSKEYCEQAVAVDPSYALAWFGLAFFYHLLGFLGYMPPKAANAQSDQAAQKALELDDMLAEAHAMLGVLRASEHDWKGAEREFRQAVELDPKSLDVSSWYDSYYLAPMRRLDEAIAASRRALELDPLSAFPQWRLGLRYHWTRQWDRAIAQFRNALELDPNYFWAHCLLGVAYASTGKFDEGIRALETAAALMGHMPFVLGCLAGAYALAGRTGETRKLLVELQDLAQKAYVGPYSFALIYGALGEIDSVFEWLEKAVDDRDSGIFYLQAEPGWDGLRSHPRFQALLRKMNLEP